MPDSRAHRSTMGAPDVFRFIVLHLFRDRRLARRVHSTGLVRACFSTPAA